jgi:hypothetical protein
VVGKPIQVHSENLSTWPRILIAVRSLHSLDSIGLAGFSYDFNSISGSNSPLVVALEALTNVSHTFSSFVMKALFFTFPSILKSTSTQTSFPS